MTAVLDLLMEGNEKMTSAVEKGANAQLIIDTVITKTGEYHQKLEKLERNRKRK